MEHIQLILVAMLGYLLGVMVRNALANLFDYIFKEEEPTQGIPIIRNYSFYNDGKPMDPNNKEVIQENIHVMEDSIEELRKYLRKLEEKEEDNDR